MTVLLNEIYFNKGIPAVLCTFLDSDTEDCLVLSLCSREFSAVRFSVSSALHFIRVFTAVHRGSTVVTNRKVAGSIPAGVSGFFIDIKSF